MTDASRSSRSSSASPGWSGAVGFVLGLHADELARHRPQRQPLSRRRHGDRDRRDRDPPPRHASRTAALERDRAG